MKKIIDFLLCILGFHDWDVIMPNEDEYFICIRCKKQGRKIGGQ